MRELWQKIVSTSGAKVYSLLVSLLLLALTARWLGPAGRGTIAAITTWAALFSTVGYLSLGQVALHYATEKRSEAWLGPVLGSLLLLTGVITLLGWLIAAGMGLATGGKAFDGISPGLMVLGFLSLPFLIWEQYGSSLLMAIDRLSVYNRAQMSGRTVGILLVFALVLGLRWGIAGVLVASLCSQMIVASMGLRLLFREAGHAVRPNGQTVRALLAGGLRLHLNAVGAFLFTSTNILVINHWRGKEETGFYQFAVQLLTVLLIVPQSASMVLYGKVTQLGPDRAWAYQRKTLVWVLAAAGVLAGISALLAPLVIPHLGSGAFGPSVGVFQLLLINLIGMTFSIVMTPQWIGRGLFWQASGLTLAVGLANLIANLMVVPRYGMVGSVWASIGTYSAAIVANLGLACWIERRFRQDQIHGVAESAA